MSSTTELLIEKRRVLEGTPAGELSSRVRRVTGLVIEAGRLPVPVGALCSIATARSGAIDAEVVGFRDASTLLMPLGEMTGVGPGDAVTCRSLVQTVPAGEGLLGRVIDGRGRPLDGKGPLAASARAPLHGWGPHPLRRRRITEPQETGIRAIDGPLTVGRGQRLGIFSGSGVGKSVLLGMIARNAVSRTDSPEAGRSPRQDVNVVALVGERAREVRDFIEKVLGEEGLARSVVVVETSERPATARVRAAFAASAIADAYRAEGRNVVLLMDSVTRLALAQREIGLSAGEPPATKGFPPSVFSMLSRLLERAGCGENGGAVTGFYAVLVEGDDLTEPVADAVRSFLDGHVVLSRELAERGHYPPVDVCKSVSRVMPDVTDAPHQAAARELISCVAEYRRAEDLINIGAYVKGSNPRIDRAVEMMPRIEGWLGQGVGEASPLRLTRDSLVEMFGGEARAQGGDSKALHRRSSEGVSR